MGKMLQNFSFWLNLFFLYKIWLLNGIFINVSQAKSLYNTDPII
ncbi:hypothetical protein HWAG_00761 [Helicobacter winghamensis ATCC BAA-430]|nr:hypothetical protein HWAG_00761 [Helicobacter winghamensis ATCC BAA-430]